jgi:hypothetical protein
MTDPEDFPVVRLGPHPSDDYVSPKTPLDYVTYNQLQDMWGAGFTIISRNTFGHDIYELADRVKRPGMARQWVDKPDIDKFLANGWRQVFNEDYHGLFAPYGYVGPIEIGNLLLVECPQHKVDKFKQEQVAAAEKLVTDWQDKWGGEFAGSVTICTQTKLGALDTVQTTQIGGTKSIETTTAIPRDMAPYIAQIFEERDALYEDLVSKWNAGEPLTEWQDAIRKAYEVQVSFNKDTLLGPTLNALILPMAIENTRTAIENTRKRINEEIDSGQAS